MKKLISLALAAALALTLAVTCAFAAPEDWQGQILPDFTVNTVGGASFTLSESLRTHDLVLINLWATWCGPCRMEFPYLETAWEQYGDRVDVIALSIENTDTFSVLRSFAGEYGLRFPIGRDETNIFGLLNGSAIPTTLIVNRDRCVVAVEIGCKTSVEEFTTLFDSLLSRYASAPAASEDRMVLYFRDPAGNPVPGVTVAFCNGTYTSTLTDENGRISFDGDPNEYHFHLFAVPDGYALPWDELHISGERYELTVTLYPN